MAAVAEQTGITTLPAYLDLAEPDLGGAVRQLADAGHPSAVIVPLLFTEAFHATVDVPETVRSVAESIPFHLIVTGILGTGDDMAQLLRESMASYWHRRSRLGVALRCRILYAGGQQGRC